jgi:mono/diheme cytochrome c family protein
MEEQADVIEQGARGKGQGARILENPYFDNKLKLSGVSCSVCHLRGGKVYGPPAREGKWDNPLNPPLLRGNGARGKGQDIHNGFVEKDFFESAEFCAACHQLDEGYELNGKVLTNTYREWKESFYGENDITCQNCHMPDRQHLWRGIHDTEMVINGIHIETIPSKKGAKLIITNTGVGHFFPTYVTPLIILKGFLLDKKDKVIPSSVKEAYIGRKVSLDLESEIFDTRITPQKSFEFDYNPSLILPLDKGREEVGLSTKGGHKLVFEVWVYPDEFYNRFFKSMLTQNGVRKGDIKKAINATEKSAYRLFRKEIN